jgi:mRNA-degrading endonuclease toxin of MazEF toxin-antitoxin module
MISPGEIYMADLLEAGRRPVLVVSRESLNRGRYIVVVAFTTARLAERRRMGNCVSFRAGEFGLVSDCVAQCDTIASVAADEIDTASGPVGMLDELTMRNIVQAIGAVIGAECEPV